MYLPNVTWKLIFVWFLEGLLCQSLLAYFFYQSWVAVGCLFPIGIFVMYRQWKKWQRQVLLEIELGFKEWLYFIKDSMNAGKSFEQAAIFCKTTFCKTLGEKNYFNKSVEQIYRGMELHIPIEKCMTKLGEETEIDVIKEFTIVFEIARKQGTHMTNTLERTIRQIYSKIELRQEIQSMIQAKKLEQQIMCVMPFFILIFVGKASGGYFTSLYHNVQGVFVMSICMCIYLLCVWWGEKLTEVSI